MLWHPQSWSSFHKDASEALFKANKSRGCCSTDRTPRWSVSVDHRFDRSSGRAIITTQASYNSAWNLGPSTNGSIQWPLQEIKVFAMVQLPSCLSTWNNIDSTDNRAPTCTVASKTQVRSDSPEDRQTFSHLMWLVNVGASILQLEPAIRIYGFRHPAQAT